jgi:hypothetical protein
MVTNLREEDRPEPWHKKKHMYQHPTGKQESLEEQLLPTTQYKKRRLQTCLVEAVRNAGTVKERGLTLRKA